MQNPLGATDFYKYIEEFRKISGKTYQEAFPDYIQFVQAKILQEILEEVKKTKK